MAKLKSILMETFGDTKVAGVGDFTVVQLTKDGPKSVYDYHGQLVRFATGKDADSYAKSQSSNYAAGAKFQTRRIKDDQWTEREGARFKSGEYKTLPWVNEVWWKNNVVVHGKHFPHVSVKNSVGLMAYTENDNTGSADIQTAIKPGRYLEKFLGEALDPFMIRDLCQQFSQTFEENCLLYADTEDLIEEIYKTGPPSCMSHPNEKYLSHIHPVRVYAGHDLKLAYMKRDNRVVARTLVWPEKKMHTRVYGDGGRIGPLLQKEGYRKGGLVGAKIARVETWQDNKRKSGNKALVLPHVDDACSVIDHGTYLVISDNNREADKNVVRMVGQSGLSAWISARCLHCNTDQQGKMVGVWANKRFELWCSECVAEHTFLCANTGQRTSNDYKVVMADGTNWWDQAFRERGFVCAGNGKNYGQSVRVSVEGKFYSKDYLAQHGHTCADCGARRITPGCDQACKDRAVDFKRAKKTGQANAAYEILQASGGGGYLSFGQVSTTAAPPLVRRPR